MLSQKLSSLHPSPTLEIASKAKAMKSRGADVISFSTGEPDLDTPQHVKNALYKAVDEGFIYYTQVAGIPELREAVSEKLKKENDIDCQPDDVIITPGAKQAIFEAIMALVNHGDEVLIPEPFWVSYVPMVIIAGGKPVSVPCNKKNGFKLEAEEIKNRISPKSKLLIINSPNNPTGAVLDVKDLKKIAEISLNNDLFVISDEIYEYIIYDRPHVSLASLNEMGDRTITVNGFSKAFSMTGWRLGYAAGPGEVIKLMRKLQSHSVSNATSFVQKAGLAALEGSKEFVEGMVEEFRKRRDTIVGLLNKIEGVECTMPEGAFYAFPDFSEIERNSVKLSNILLEDALVATVPGAAFGKVGEGFIRFSFATSMEKIIDGMERVQKTLRRNS